MRSSSYLSLHRTGRIASLVGVLFASLLVFVPPVQADLGPKPSMDFEFHYESGAPLTIVEGSQLECDDATCSDAEPLLEGGPQRFTCSQDRCSSSAYGYSAYHRLVIHFSDGVTRESNVFSKSHFSAIYRVTVREDDLVVEEIGGQARPAPSLGSLTAFALGAIVVGGGITMLFAVALLIVLVRLIVKAGQNQVSFAGSRGLFIAVWCIAALTLIFSCIIALIFGSAFSLSLLITILMEGLIALIYAFLRGRSRSTLLTLVTLVNLMTQPLLWFLMVLVDWVTSPSAQFISAARAPDLSYGILAIAELLIWLLEAVLLYLMQRRTFSFKEALGLSFIINAASFIAGLLLPV